MKYFSQESGYFNTQHLATTLWLSPIGIFAQIKKIATDKQVELARCLVLLPLNQHLTLARQLWIQAFPNSILPRFETLESLNTQYNPTQLSGADVLFDKGLDLLTIRAMLGTNQEEQSLAELILQNTYQLASSIRAINPKERAYWVNEALAITHKNLSNDWFIYEKRAIETAITWLSKSSFHSDWLFDTEPHKLANLVFWVKGHDLSPMISVFRNLWQEKFSQLTFPKIEINPPCTQTVFRFLPCMDRVDEINRTAQCVIELVRQGKTPVALSSTQWASMKRVTQLLSAAQITIKNENGWKLSTSVASAQLVTLLQAIHTRSSIQEIIALIKIAPAYKNLAHEVTALCRQKQIRHWHDLATHLPSHPLLTQLFTAIIHSNQNTQQARTWIHWLIFLQAELKVYELSLTDLPGGPEVTKTLHLDAITTSEEIPFDSGALWSDMHINFDTFFQWVATVLESTTYQAQSQASQAPQVIVLPMEQMLARPFASTVLMDADEHNLNLANTINSSLPPSVTQALGLPSKEEQKQAIYDSFHATLLAEESHIFWSKISERGEPVTASALILQLQLHLGQENEKQSLLYRKITPQPYAPPSPQAPQLTLLTLSASRYDDLRKCPYRFFAMHQLALSEEADLDFELENRDFGNWLHKVLNLYQEQNKKTPFSNKEERISAIDSIAQRTINQYGFREEDFFPYQATWPALRDGYLKWEETHSKEGYSYENGELTLTRSLADITLTGRLDRLDKSVQGDHFLIDYKTGSKNGCRNRINVPLEDTQMLFYSLLIDSNPKSDDDLKTAYLSITAKDGSCQFVHTITKEEKTLIKDGLIQEMTALKKGHPLLALGEGETCTYCNVKNLCRKDFWAGNK